MSNQTKSGKPLPDPEISRTLPFGWESLRERSIMCKLRRAHCMAKNTGTGMDPINKEFSTKHPSWIRDAESNNFTVMDTKIKQEFDKKIEEVMARRQKLTP